jgi:hypothetical protein
MFAFSSLVKGEENGIDCSQGDKPAERGKRARGRGEGGGGPGQLLPPWLLRMIGNAV